MLKEYCRNPECGKATEYSLTKPSFCCGCGQPFSGTKIIARKPQTVVRRPVAAVEEEEYVEPEEFDLSNAKVAFEYVPSPPARIPIEQIGQPDEQFSPRQTPKLTNKARKEKVEAFKQRLATRSTFEQD